MSTNAHGQFERWFAKMLSKRIEDEASKGNMSHVIRITIIEQYKAFSKVEDIQAIVSKLNMTVPYTVELLYDGRYSVKTYCEYYKIFVNVDQHVPKKRKAKNGNVYTYEEFTHHYLKLRDRRWNKATSI